MSISKKDYTTIAIAFIESRPVMETVRFEKGEDWESAWTQWTLDIIQMANVLEKTYPNFDRNKFMGWIFGSD